MTAQQFLANKNLTIDAVPNIPGLLNREPNSAHFQGDTYNIGLEYDVTNTVMAYGGYRRGFKQGGFNVSAPVSDPGEQGFAPESDDDFYLGLKTSFHVGDISGRFNIEGYYDLYHNKQESYLTLTGSGPTASLSTVTYNVPETTYRGLDADLTVDLTHWLRVNANYSYIDAFYTKWSDTTFPATKGSSPACTGLSNPSCPNLNLNLAVNPVSFVSPNKFSITARFHTELPDDRGELAFAPTVTYQDRWYTIGDAFLLPQGESSWLGLPANYNSAAKGGDFVNSYALVNLRFEWNRVWGSHVDAAVNVTNVTNKAYSIGDTTSIGDGVQSDSYGPPRMVTFELSTKF
jgi:iron complex outermembrane receptor protein